MTGHSALSVEKAVKYAEHLAVRIRSASSPDVDPGSVPTVTSVGVCGVGVMGAGVAAACLKNGIPVTLFDASSEALERGLRLIDQELTECDQSLRLYTEPLLSNLKHGGGSCDRRLLRTAERIGDLSNCDLVLESVVESKELKVRVLRQLEDVVDSQKVLATNTSTLSVTQLARELRHAERFCGIHFFNPICARPLVEIVPPAQASNPTLARVMAFAHSIDKLPIVVRDRPGFLVNRLLVPYMNEALELVCEGVDIRTIDQAALDFGMPLGPLALFDLIGLETAMLGGRTIWEAFPDRVTLTPVLPALLKRGRQGRRSLLGFYRYRDELGNGQEFDPEFARIVEPYIRPPAYPNTGPIMMRLLLPMLLEATRALEEGVVSSPEDADAGVLFGLAFPTCRGGLMYWADQLGPRRILQLLEPLQPLGPRMKPSEWLRSHAERQQRLVPVVA